LPPEKELLYWQTEDALPRRLTPAIGKTLETRSVALFSAPEAKTPAADLDYIGQLPADKYRFFLLPDFYDWRPEGFVGNSAPSPEASHAKVAKIAKVAG
jgi:hypothetical protein